MPKELAVYEKPKAEIVQRARALEVNSPEAMQEATEILSTLNKYLDSVVAYKEKKTKPLNEALKVIRAETKPIETELEALIADIRSSMGEYQTAQTRQIALESAKIAEKVSEGKLRVETGLKKLEGLERPEEALHSSAGTVKFRTDKVLVITDAALIPDEYWELNEAKLLKALKSGLTIPGATTEEKQTPVNYR